jgi:hypothetical protein
MSQKNDSSTTKNYLAIESKLIIFSDGAKNETAKPKVTEVRNYLKKYRWICFYRNYRIYK